MFNDTPIYADECHHNDTYVPVVGHQKYEQYCSPSVEVALLKAIQLKYDQGGRNFEFVNIACLYFGINDNHDTNKLPINIKRICNVERRIKGYGIDALYQPVVNNKVYNHFAELPELAILIALEIKYKQSKFKGLGFLRLACRWFGIPSKWGEWSEIAPRLASLPEVKQIYADIAEVEAKTRSELGRPLEDNWQPNIISVG